MYNLEVRNIGGLPTRAATGSTERDWGRENGCGFPFSFPKDDLTKGTLKLLVSFQMT